MNDKSLERIAGMIRKIPGCLFPSIMSQKKILKDCLNIQENNKKDNLLKEENMIENSEAIIRLKKRIKNRMIGQNSGC